MSFSARGSLQLSLGISSVSKVYFDLVGFSEHGCWDGLVLSTSAVSRTDAILLEVCVQFEASAALCS